MKISLLMSKNLFTVAMDDAISKVKDIFETKGFHHMLVVENEKLCGVIADRDLLKAISPNVDNFAASNQDLATLNKRAHQIMVRNPISLSQHASVIDAVKLFNEHKITCIPIVDEENRPVGIVSWRDIMRVIIKKKAPQ
ncbi:acetoin utilization protein AcuB [Colwellia chukchiensis]|uniref:Acetoin utilization protein AcuB n=2 Tax=Colwellia chukchiensis TaxID=641665 RepID=A0A1H7NA40_9GAMM|nr:acetoin utilization protein AcuB [Colwellia chukchiensis]